MAGRLGEDRMDDVTVYVGQTAIDAVVPKRQTRVVDA